MKLIVNVNKNWGIGANGDLLCHIPEDMKFFRETTKNSVVIMGRKTLDSFPGGKPLKNRTNIVLTRNENFSRDGVEVYPDKESVLRRVADEDNVFVIGGGEIYRMFLDDCDTAYVTKTDDTRSADIYFPDLDSEDGWRCVYTSEEKYSCGMRFVFTTYKKMK